MLAEAASKDFLTLEIMSPTAFQLIRISLDTALLELLIALGCYQMLEFVNETGIVMSPMHTSNKYTMLLTLIRSAFGARYTILLFQSQLRHRRKPGPLS